MVWIGLRDNHKASRQTISNVIFPSFVALAATIVAARPAVAQQAEAAERQPVAKSGIDRTPSLHGTVRAKWEYQPDDDLNRFEVRNARLSVDGRLTPVISYKAEIDLAAIAIAVTDLAATAPPAA